MQLFPTAYLTISYDAASYMAAHASLGRGGSASQGCLPLHTITGSSSETILDLQIQPTAHPKAKHTAACSGPLGPLWHRGLQSPGNSGKGLWSTGHFFHQSSQVKAWGLKGPVRSGEIKDGYRTGATASSAT